MDTKELIERLEEVGTKPVLTLIAERKEAASLIKSQASRIEALEAMLREASLQLTYLNEKQERGTTNAVLTRIDAILSVNEESQG